MQWCMYAKCMFCLINLCCASGVHFAIGTVTGHEMSTIHKEAVKLESMRDDLEKQGGMTGIANRVLSENQETLLQHLRAIYW